MEESNDKYYKKINRTRDVATLIIFTLVGIGIGVVLVSFGRKYIEFIINNSVYLVLILFFGLLILWLLFEAYRDKIAIKLFGENLDDINTIKAGTNDFVDTLLVATLPTGTEENVIREKRKGIVSTINFVLWRSLRVRKYRLFILIFGALGAFFTEILLVKQNELLKIQNEKIDVQISLEEANRRSSLIFLMSNIMDNVDKELSKVDIHKNRIDTLSDGLIGRIVALSYALKPYRYLNESQSNKPGTEYKSGDVLTRSYSPERGQLLIAIASFPLSDSTRKKIFEKATFKNADLVRANLKGIDFSYVDLEYANLEYANFYRSTFRRANLAKTNLGHADFSNADLERADLRSANLKATNLYCTKLVNTQIQDNKSYPADILHSITDNKNWLNDMTELYRKDSGYQNDPHESLKLVPINELKNVFRVQFKNNKTKPSDCRYWK